MKTTPEERKKLRTIYQPFLDPRNGIAVAHIIENLLDDLEEEHKQVLLSKTREAILRQTLRLIRSAFGDLTLNKADYSVTSVAEMVNEALTSKGVKEDCCGGRLADCKTCGCREAGNASYSCPKHQV